MNVEKATVISAAERVGISPENAAALWEALNSPASLRSGWFTPENIAPYLAPMKAVYSKLFGPEAAMSSIPLALLRAVYGDELTIGIRGKPFTVSLHDTIVSFEILLYRKWQPFETMIYEQLVRPDDYVVDVGANIGFFTVLFAELVGDAGRVLAIEPEPGNIRLLRKNIEAGGALQVVTVAETAVGADSGVASLYKASSGNQGDHRMYFTPERPGLAPPKQREAVEVPVARVDDLVSEWPRVDFIKMDIQGFEAQALKGMQHLLEANPDVILFTEFWPFGIRAAGSDPFAFLAELRFFGFEIWEMSVSKGPLNEVVRSDDRQFVERIEPNRQEANLLCARTEKSIRRIRRLCPV
ncbi:MAG: FkbM family methyltransferase [Vulcanimicrobiaceae bacterium]